MKKLIEKMIFLGLSPKKEFTVLAIVSAIFCVLGITSFLIFKDLLYILFGIGLAAIFSFAFLTRYSKKIDEINATNLQEFATLFGYFKIYIHNGFSVYTALKEITLFANPYLREMIDTLIKEIDEDKTVQPFINFSKNFNEIIIEEMMISIYQMIDDGESSNYLAQFELIFDKFSEVLYQKNLRIKDSKLGTILSAPLIGSCFLMVVLTIGIISVIGELINGL